MLSSDLRTVDVAAPLEQPLKFWEVARDGKVSAWRAGLDNALDADKMDALASALVARELDDAAVAVSTTE